jgi:hypothetical protein
MKACQQFFVVKLHMKCAEIVIGLTGEPRFVDFVYLVVAFRIPYCQGIATIAANQQLRIKRKKSHRLRLVAHRQKGAHYSLPQIPYLNSLLRFFSSIAK